MNKVLLNWQNGMALPGALYSDPELYEAEIRRIFLKSWLYVGHMSQIPERGDYFLFEIAGESVIVVRAADGQRESQNGGRRDSVADRRSDGRADDRADGEINALLNVCRHRGSRICDDASGHSARLTCRYHGWTYGLDGSLRAASHMPDNLDRSKLGLRRLHVRVFAGLIFINFDAEPVPFDAIENDLATPLAPYDLAHTKIAHRQNYPMTSNWKVAVENYCECYHCAPAHPEYSVGHGRAIPYAAMAEQLKQVMSRAHASGLTTHDVRRSWLDAGALGTERGFERYALLRGHQTGSRDGQPVAPLLGSITAYDGGATDLHLGPTTFGLAYCDHVVLYRFTPRGLRNTDCEITWLVKDTAREGHDYDRAALTWLWDVTTLADKQIIERNQLGMNSRFYEPGPLSPMEDFTRRFLEWYVSTMRQP